MKYLHSFVAIAKREWIELKRYWFNSLIGLVIYIAIFTALFRGAQYIGQNNYALNESLEGFLIGYGLWFMAMGAFSETAHSIIDEARKGTLEQLYMTELPFVWLLISKNIISTVIFSFMFLLIIWIQMMITGIQLHMDIISIFTTLMIGLFGLYGVGLIMAGLGLLFKRIQNLLGATQFIIVGVMVASPTEIPVVRFLPFVHARELIMAIMRDGVSILQFSSYDWVFLILNSLFYLGLGIFLYKLAEKEVLRRGMLGQY